MTDSEIIKALECCVLYKQICPETCPMVNVKQCKLNLRKDALDLINRQKAEIERLQNHIAEVGKKVKAEAVKEFAERLKDIYSYPKYYRPNAYTTIPNCSLRLTIS